ncbi:MAG: hypothetical protein H6625_05675 [Bdellovibrionaceae bacterium]|nr:hypothetical protein [Pseudobdellovibrionaceae bacterium]
MIKKNRHVFLILFLILILSLGFLIEHFLLLENEFIPDKNAFRVLCVGDSISFKYPRYLEHYLNSLDTDNKYQVRRIIRYGDSPKNISQETINVSKQYRPDIIIGMYGAYDYSGNRSDFFENNRRENEKFFGFLNIIRIKKPIFRLMDKMGLNDSWIYLLLKYSSKFSSHDQILFIHSYMEHKDFSSKSLKFMNQYKDFLENNIKNDIPLLNLNSGKTAKNEEIYYQILRSYRVLAALKTHISYILFTKSKNKKLNRLKETIQSDYLVSKLATPSLLNSIECNQSTENKNSCFDATITPIFFTAKLMQLLSNNELLLNEEFYGISTKFIEYYYLRNNKDLDSLYSFDNHIGLVNSNFSIWESYRKQIPEFDENSELKNVDLAIKNKINEFPFSYKKLLDRENIDFLPDNREHIGKVNSEIHSSLKNILKNKEANLKKLYFISHSEFDSDEELAKLNLNSEINVYPSNLFFGDLLASDGYSSVYSDRVAKKLGHLTTLGNQILAKKLTILILNDFSKTTEK